MPSKKKKYNARFPPARIKKIMQTDEDVGKVAAAVPVIISRALELFIESLILKSNDTTQSRNARTLSTAHIKHIIESEKKFDFLRDLVANIPDIQQNEEDGDSQSGLEGVDPAPPAPSEARAAPAPAARSNSTTERPAKRPRGRPRKIKPEEEQQLPPKKRGRRKKQKEETTDDSATEDANSNAGSDSTEEAASPAAREADGAGVVDGGDLEGSSGMPFARYTGQSSPTSNRTADDIKPVDIKPELVDEAAHRVSPTNSDIKDEPETKEDKKVPGHRREQGLEQQSDPVSEEEIRRRHPTPETSVANHERMVRSAEAPTGPGYSTHPHHLMHPAPGIPPYPVPAHMPMPTAANNCSVPGVPHPYPGGFHPSLPPPPTVPTAPLPPFQMPMSFYGSYPPPPTGGPTPPPPRPPPPAGHEDYDS